jgi:hypothetical protein
MAPRKVIDAHVIKWEPSLLPYRWGRALCLKGEPRPVPMRILMALSGGQFFELVDDYASGIL